MNWNKGESLNLSVGGCFSLNSKRLVLGNHCMDASALDTFMGGRIHLSGTGHAKGVLLSVSILGSYFNELWPMQLTNVPTHPMLNSTPNQ